MDSVSSSNGGGEKPIISDVTRQLLENAVKVNPFEAKFKEANRRLSMSQGEELNSDPVMTSVSRNSDGMSTLDTPAIELCPKEGKTDTQRKSSASSSSGLSLRIPPTLTSQSPGLFSTVSMLEYPGGGVDTPEIAKLLNLYDGKGNVPRTAEVLNTVLDIGNQSRKNTLSPQVPVNLSESNEIVLSESQRLVSSPPNLGSGNEEETQYNQGNDAPESVANGEALMLSVRLGGPAGQLVNIPVELGLTANKKAALLQKTDALPVMNTIGVNSLAAANLNDFGRQVLMSKSGQAEITSDYGTDVMEKRKDIMDRNKAAAVRYRKRKKEEHHQLQDKVSRLEEEKLELSTKVIVLQRELDRMSRRMNAHRKCTCRCEEALVEEDDSTHIDVSRVSPADTKATLLGINYKHDSDTPKTAYSGAKQVVSGSYVLQPILTAFPGQGSTAAVAVVGSQGGGPQFNLVPMVPVPATKESSTPNREDTS